MQTVDFTKVTAHDPMKHMFRVVGYRNGVRCMNAVNLTFSEARGLAKRDKTLSIYSLRALCPSI